VFLHHEDRAKWVDGGGVSARRSGRIYAQNMGSTIRLLGITAGYKKYRG
jgi:hypothetical protein